jgi:hypothetical protein
MKFVKTFKGYEDKVGLLDGIVNQWVAEHKIEILSIETAMSHEVDNRAQSGDLIYTIIYKADEPIV